jgi:predicted phosphodiesterase
MTAIVRPLVAIVLLTLGIGCDRELPAPEPRHSAPAEVPVVRPLAASSGSGSLLLPDHTGSVKFAVIGDSGRGNQPQYEVAAQMLTFHDRFSYSFVLMTGDNIYEGPATPSDYREKFEKPYQQLLDRGVKFYAVLGNHDDPRQVDYAPFNMQGHRYYTFRPPEDPVTRLLTSVRFFALDTVTLDREEIRWAATEVCRSDSHWKIVFAHHPLYTSGRYRQSAALVRAALEPTFLRCGVDVVFSGHEHFYMRSELQGGIQYFISGGAGSLRYGDSRRSPLVADAFDTDYHFLLIELERDVMSFQAIARTGETIDSGALYRRDDTTWSTDTPALPQSAAPVP